MLTICKDLLFKLIKLIISLISLVGKFDTIIVSLGLYIEINRSKSSNVQGFLIYSSLYSLI